MRERRFFDDEEDWAMIRMRAAGDMPQAIADALGRNKLSIKSRLQRYGAHTVKGAEAVIKSGVLLHPARALMHFVDGPTLAPGMLDEREQREQARGRRTLTASLCGDPPPGYSALDKRDAGLPVARPMERAGR